LILTQIVAVSDNYAIGKDNKLLWHYPEDLKYFKNQTLGKVIIMGRKTFDSFGGKPLPKRFHIVISRTSQKSEFDNVVYVSTIDQALKIARDQSTSDEIMIIGGAEIYKQTLPLCHKLLITRVRGHFDADTFYPEEFMNYFKLQSQLKAETTDQIVFETWVKL